MRVPIDGGARFAAGTPTQLFDTRPFVVGASLGRTYDVSPDGQRFLMIKEGGASGETSTSNSIIVVEHWFEELKAKVPRP